MGPGPQAGYKQQEAESCSAAMVQEDQVGLRVGGLVLQLRCQRGDSTAG